MRNVIVEIDLYFDEGSQIEPGGSGYSGYYCTKAFNKERLENDASTDIFCRLLLLDTKNDANMSRVLRVVCMKAAFKQLQVCVTLVSDLIKSLTLYSQLA